MINKRERIHIINKDLERAWVVLFLNFYKTNKSLNPGFSCGSSTHVDEGAGRADSRLEKWPCDHHFGPRSQAYPKAMNLNPLPTTPEGELNDKSPNGEED